MVTLTLTITLSLGFDVNLKQWNNCQYCCSSWHYSLLTVTFVVYFKNASLYAFHFISLLNV